MTEYLKRTWARVDLDAIVHNYRVIRSYVRPGCKILAVVKADAYGHGVSFVAKELDTAGADWFGVSNLEEALQLRRTVSDKPVLILGPTPVSRAEDLVRFHITQTVPTLEYARALSEQAARCAGKVDVHLKLDTGMGRIGFLYDDASHTPAALDEMEQAAAQPGLHVTGVFTHFAVSDEPQNPYTRRQFTLFTDACDKLKARGVDLGLRHCCNSAGLLNFPEMHLDMVRPGIILYGLTPAVGMPIPIALRPAMELKSGITQVKTLGSGVPLSYGLKYRTTRPTTVATIPIGYADGFPRSLTNNDDVLVNGRRAAVIGRVCMDQCMADVTGIPDVKAGTVATIVGHDGDAFLPMEELAERMGTINYEVICLIGKRVPRVYLRGGREVGLLNYILSAE